MKTPKLNRPSTRSAQSGRRAKEGVAEATGTSTPLPMSVLARLAGASLPLLPGESEEDYRRGLLETIKELGASTHLQIYLAEKIFDCVWWMRRLETQKTLVLKRRMATLLQYHADGLDIQAILEDGVWDHEAFLKVVGLAGYTVQSLVAKATSAEIETIGAMDDQIGDRLKTLRGLQSAYESLVNRKVMIERLQLQNDLLKRDLGAIEAEK